MSDGLRFDFRLAGGLDEMSDLLEHVNGPGYLSLIRDYDEALRSRAKHGGEEWAQAARDLLRSMLLEAGIGID